MRAPPGRLTIAAACCAALAAVPASVAHATSTGGTLSTGVASTPAAASSAAVHLVAAPTRPTVGTPVRLSVSAAPLGATGFAWDLAGRGDFSRHTAGPGTVIAFTTPGTHTVAVRFRDLGHTVLGVATVIVGPRPPSAARARSVSGPRARPRPRPHPAAPSASSGLTGRVTAHAAGDPGVTIADFHFSPASTTIHVGDTITWSNSGPSSHTATATGGSFNTGILKKGQSASHTFTQPGTFTYACQIHPFMHGTIVVLASTTTSSAGTTTPTTTTPATSTSPTTTAPAQTGPTLPNTGFNVLGGLLAGLLLVGLGAGLRRTRAR